MVHDKRTALSVGRFQPFHNGHLSTILQINNDGFDEIVIGIGSSQISGTDKNPFSAEERKEMIEAALSKHHNLNYKIVLMPDTNNDDLWVGSVEKVLKENAIGKIDEVYTNNSLVKRLFEEAGYKVKEPALLKRGVEVLSGTIIRKMMREGDKSWKKLVPKEVCAKIAQRSKKV